MLSKTCFTVASVLAFSLLISCSGSGGSSTPVAVTPSNVPSAPGNAYYPLDVGNTWTYADGGSLSNCSTLRVQSNTGTAMVLENNGIAGSDGVVKAISNYVIAGQRVMETGGKDYRSDGSLVDTYTNTPFRLVPFRMYSR